ncbi:DNA repair protein RadA [Serpentinicella alkaliphila]|uniref:DNA repair protein RadA n=1 Tax=Serpentinicella alkaliphila TaxID=1734049 RepID=A0A4V2T397_9FIRM|nr:DNA repair protein RadA [Serpentinicella alkaliphila]QUH25409.1 DNA repair protein RadA [Serpentinicella alkaliphila]TCQ00614.1 DNA repair protein RadA/Sms [Serpentinicella alkaliphila]
MGKSKTKYICQQCGYESPKWFGMCPGCSQWNTMEEEFVDNSKSFKRSPTVKGGTAPQPIKEVKTGDYIRYDTQIQELNRVLGGGLVKGSLTLISGEPGIGKSTLILQAAGAIANKYGKTLYVSGEESEEQIKMRAERLKTLEENLYIVSETNINRIEKFIENMEPVFVIIDSVQTLYKEEIVSAPGSVSQVKESVNNLMRIGKSSNIPIFLVAHVTKQGELAGPRVLEHMVDTVLHFEGERTQEFRILRALKNRFGTTSEIGVFEMSMDGLIEITNPSGIFLETLNPEAEGSIVVGTVEGTRPLLVEIQALVTSTTSGFPRRTAVGVDTNRLNLIIAVLEKKVGLPLSFQDIYVNVVGGLKLEGTSADLGIAMAIYSSVRGIKIPSGQMVAIGEVSLTGEIRPVTHIEKLVKEAEKMGFKNCIIPNRNKAKLDGINSNVIGVTGLKDALDIIIS